MGEDAARRFVRNSYRHGKAVGGYGGGAEALRAMLPTSLGAAPGGGVVTDDAGADAFCTAFAEAVGAHRHWGRPELDV